MTFPLLEDWLLTAQPTIVWKKLLSFVNARPDAILASLERIITVLERANPKRLPSKKKQFRSDPVDSNQINLRFELLTAAHCALSGYSFEFGGDGQEDLFLEIPNRTSPLGIECGSRTKRDIWLLHDVLEDELAGFNDRVVLSFPEKVLHISEADRQLAVERIRQHISSTETELLSVYIPEIPLTAIFFKDGEEDENASISGLKVTVATGANLWKVTDTMLQEIEVTINAKIEQAQRQNRQRDSILMVHISRVDEAFLRSMDFWRSDLEQMILKYPDLPFSAIGFSLNDLTSEDLKMVYALNPKVDATTASHVSELLAKLASRGSFP